MPYTEADYENAIIELFVNMGYRHLYGPEISRDYHSPMYDPELISSIHRINPICPKTQSQSLSES